MEATAVNCSHCFNGWKVLEGFLINFFLSYFVGKTMKFLNTE